MSVRQFISITAVSCLILGNMMAQNASKGYYKDLLVDGGAFLTPRNYLPATQYMNLSEESFLNTPKDDSKSVYN